MAFTPSPEQNKPTKEDSVKKDEYHGQYKDPHYQASEEDKTGNSQNPVRNDAPPWKNLKTAGG